MSKSNDIQARRKTLLGRVEALEGAHLLLRDATGRHIDLVLGIMASMERLEGLADRLSEEMDLDVHYHKCLAYWFLPWWRRVLRRRP